MKKFLLALAFSLFSYTLWAQCVNNVERFVSITPSDLGGGVTRISWVITDQGGATVKSGFVDHQSADGAGIPFIQLLKIVQNAVQDEFPASSMQTSFRLFVNEPIVVPGLSLYTSGAVDVTVNNIAGVNTQIDYSVKNNAEVEIATGTLLVADTSQEGKAREVLKAKTREALTDVVLVEDVPANFTIGIVPRETQGGVTLNPPYTMSVVHSSGGGNEIFDWTVQDASGPIDTGQLVVATGSKSIKTLAHLRLTGINVVSSQFTMADAQAAYTIQAYRPNVDIGQPGSGPYRVETTTTFNDPNYEVSYSVKNASDIVLASDSTTYPSITEHSKVLADIRAFAFQALSGEYTVSEILGTSFRATPPFAPSGVELFVYDDQVWDGIYRFDHSQWFRGPKYLWREDPATEATEGLAYFYYASEPVTGGPYTTTTDVNFTLSGITAYPVTSGGNDTTSTYPRVLSNVQPGGNLQIKVIVDSDAQLGDGQMIFTVVSGGITETICHNITVKDTIILNEPDPLTLDFPPIPGLAAWEASMTTKGAQYDEPGEQNPTWEGGVWYYDGIRVFYQIADYTSDPAWETAAQVVRDYAYLIQLGYPPACGVQGYRRFTTGLREDYERTDFTTSLGALQCLSEGSAWDFRAYRETAYQLLALIDSEKVGYAYNKAWRKPKTVSVLLGGLDWQLTQMHNCETRNDMQPFFIGLMAEALIASYEWDQERMITPDYRIPEMLKEAADSLWNVAWIPGGPFPNVMFYSCLEPYGSKGKSPAYALQNLIAPLYAKLYRWYGDPVDRDRADLLFANAAAVLKSPNCCFTGKEFSQNFRWSFDYYRWRTGQ